MGGSKPKPRHPLILDGLCLHVLSSFQRTGGPGRPGRRRKSFPANAFQRKHPSEGEPYEFTISSTVCQPEMGLSSPIWIGQNSPKLPECALQGQGLDRQSAAQSVPLRTLYVTPPASPRQPLGESGNLAICNLAIVVLQIAKLQIAELPIPGVNRRREWLSCSPASGTSRTRPSDTAAAGAGARAGASRGTPRASGPSACRPCAAT